jgi:hypothetical protein
MTTQDIDGICCKLSQEANPPEAFLVASDSIEGQLLGVSIFFLEDGQQLPCPGPPLTGAAFGPDWGFSQAEVGKRPDGSLGFRLPNTTFENLANGSSHGYRLDIIDDHEVTGAIRQLASIRAKLLKHRVRKHAEHSGSEVNITRL